jgi:outer membrane receptor protein involved in Fe transport
VRWEGIRTDSSGTGLIDTRSDVHVLSPVVQTLYKFPDKSGRQLRMALTHTFKAPETWQLNARRFDAALNTRFTPDSTGNPALRPEEANGLDLTYEHFWAPGAVYSLGTSVRGIHNYIRSTLTQDAQGLWVVRPVNDGNAQVRTLDFDAKFPLKTVMKDAPPVDLRLSLNRNWSKVDAVPGPDNRLDQQIPFSAVFGADYKKEPFSFGINLAYRAGGDVRISQEQGARLQARRDVDAYFQYSPRKDLDLRDVDAQPRFNGIAVQHGAQVLGAQA